MNTPATPTNNPPAAGQAAHTSGRWPLNTKVSVHINTGMTPDDAISIFFDNSKGNGDHVDCTAHGASLTKNELERRLNSHAALVAALRAILHDHATCVACEQPGFLTESQVDQARAALAAAKEGA